MNIFEQAVRLKLRFSTSKGVCSTEDLFDMKLEPLDKLAQAFHKRLQDGCSISFITTVNPEDKMNQLQFDIVKYVIDLKLAAIETQKAAVARKAQKQEILGLINTKKSEAMAGKSIEELTALLEAL